MKNLRKHARIGTWHLTGEWSARQPMITGEWSARQPTFSLRCQPAQCDFFMLPFALFCGRSFVGRNCDGWVLVDEGFGKVNSCRNCSFPVHDRSRNCDISRGNWDPETILCVKSSGKASWMQGCTGFRRLLTLRFVAPNCLAVIVSDCMRVSVRKADITCVTKWWFLARR